MGVFGVHYAEIGFAGANHFVTQLSDSLRNADTGAMKLALFGRTRGRGTRVEHWPDLEFMTARRHHIPAAVIVVKSRLLDVERSLETTPEENLLMARETIVYLQDQGLEVLVDLEHAMDAACGRQEFGHPSAPDFASQTLDHFHALVSLCVDQHVSRIVICDTQRRGQPGRGFQPSSAASSSSHPSASFGFHGHTDRGLGVANARAAVLAGAAQVQGTLLGTGERCGNVNLHHRHRRHAASRRS